MSALDWTDEMVECLRRLRSGNVPLYLCAEKIGVCYRAVVHKARELGIADRRNCGRRRGQDLLR